MNPLFSESVSAELAYLRQLLDEYASRHPKVSNRLRYKSGVTSDASVGRLAQAFSFLLARTQRRIDDHFPQLLKPFVDLVGMPGPATIPSLATVEFSLNPDQPPDVSGGGVPRGTQLASEPINGVSASFRTCSDVLLWPLEVSSASLVFPPFHEHGRVPAEATCAVNLSLRTLASNIMFHELGLDHLRFFLCTDMHEALSLYDALFADALEIVFHAPGTQPQRLGPDALHPAGFSPRERLFPGASYDGARALVEFLCFPEKFLYFELHDLGSVLRSFSGTGLEIDIYLRSSKELMPRRLPPGSLRLFCSPAINLFDRQSTPMEVKSRSDRLLLAVDSEYPRAYEIHSINKVVIRDSKDQELVIPRFHGPKQFSSDSSSDIRWEYDTLEQSAVVQPGTTVALRFVDSEFAPRKLENCVVQASVTCSNGDWLRQLPFGDKGTPLQAESLPLVSECRLLSPPTRLRRLGLARTTWERAAQRLPDATTIASAGGAAALRSAIQILACDEDEILQSLVASLVDVRIVRSTGIVHGRMLCHGVEVVLVFRRTAQLLHGHLLFVRVLQELLAQYATEGVIFRLRSTYEDGREVLQCPRRSGGRFVI